MTYFDIDNLLDDGLDRKAIGTSICDASATELVDTYKALCDFLVRFLKYPDLPQIAFILSEFKYAYALEITNRYLSSHGFSSLDIPDVCLSGDLESFKNILDV